jgi:phosphate transport system substrate-binding protein
MKRIETVIFLLFLGLASLSCGKKQSESNPEIKVYTRDTTSGTRDGFFTNIGFDDAVKDNTVLVNGYVEVEGNGNMINSIKKDPYGIGYISLASLAGSDLKGLKYNGIEPTEGNVLNNTYSLKRNFNYAIRSENYWVSADEKAIVKAYIAYMGTIEGKTVIAANDGIIDIRVNDPSWDDIKNLYPITQKDNSGITIKFGGSTSVQKIAEALSADFKGKCGNFVPQHNHIGSGDAYKRLQGSEKDGSNKLHIGFASREFKINDTEPLETGTYGRICTDAIVAVVNRTNSLSEITSSQLISIYSGNISKWSEVE